MTGEFCRVGQVVGIKLARGQTLQIHVGFELRVKLLMGGMIAVQGNDLSGAELLWQHARPAFEHILGQQQNHPELVNGALCEAIDTSRRVGCTAHIDQIQTLLPDALPLARAMHRPLRAGISRPSGSNSLHRGSARVPLDEQSDLARQRFSLSGDLLHQLQRTKAQIGPHQQGRGHQTGSHWQNALKVVLALSRRMLHPRARCQFKAVAQAAQIHRQQAVAVDTGVSASYQFFLGGTVVHGKGVQINPGVAAGQGAEVNGLAIDAAGQQLLVHLGHQIKPVKGIGIQTLAQGGTRWNIGQSQGTHEEGVGAKVLDHVKVVLARHSRPRYDLRVELLQHQREPEKPNQQSVDIDVFKIFANERQAGVGTEVVGQFFDNEFGHGLFTFRVSSLLHLTH